MVKEKKARAICPVHGSSYEEIERSNLQGVDLDVLTGWLSAAFDRAVLDLQAGRDAAAVRRTLRWLLGRILPDGAPPARSARRPRP